jgi:hypothetical protein
MASVNPETVLQPTAAVREPFAAGDHLVRHPAGSDSALTIEAAFEKPGWRPRTAATLTSIAHPGTAIRFEDSLYEIVGAEPALLAGSGVLYHLKPWDDAYTIRRIVAYDRKECRRLAAERAVDRRDARMGLPLVLLTPLIGLLPADDQRRIEWRYGIGSRLATLVSALLLMFVGAPGVISSLVAFFARAFGASSADFVPWPYHYFLVQLLAQYFFVESCLRLHVCLAQDRPTGSLPVVLCLQLARKIRARYFPS